MARANGWESAAIWRPIPAAAAILIGLDVDELSVGIPNIPALKAQIRDMAYEDAKELAKRALACGAAEEVRALTEEVA